VAGKRLLERGLEGRLPLGLDLERDLHVIGDLARSAEPRIATAPLGHFSSAEMIVAHAMVPPCSLSFRSRPFLLPHIADSPIRSRARPQSAADDNPGTIFPNGHAADNSVQRPAVSCTRAFRRSRGAAPVRPSRMLGGVPEVSCGRLDAVKRRQPRAGVFDLALDVGEQRADRAGVGNARELDTTVEREAAETLPTSRTSCAHTAILSACRVLIDSSTGTGTGGWPNGHTSLPAQRRVG
jgi:hypothetical protein